MIFNLRVDIKSLWDNSLPRSSEEAAFPRQVGRFFQNDE
jgi:hypothetical protein